MFTGCTRAWARELTRPVLAPRSTRSAARACCRQADCPLDRRARRRRGLFMGAQDVWKISTKCWGERGPNEAKRVPSCPAGQLVGPAVQRLQPAAGSGRRLSARREQRRNTVRGRSRCPSTKLLAGGSRSRHNRRSCPSSDGLPGGMPSAVRGRQVIPAAWTLEARARRAAHRRCGLPFQHCLASLSAADIRIRRRTSGIARFRDSVPAPGDGIFASMTREHRLAPLAVWWLTER